MGERHRHRPRPGRYGQRHTDHPRKYHRFCSEHFHGELVGSLAERPRYHTGDCGNDAVDRRFRQVHDCPEQISEDVLDILPSCRPISGENIAILEAGEAGDEAIIPLPELWSSSLSFIFVPPFILGRFPALQDG